MSFTTSFRHMKDVPTDTHRMFTDSLENHCFYSQISIQTIIHTYIHICIYINMNTYTCICILVYSYIYMYMFTYRYTSIYIYIIASKSFPDDIHVRRTLRCAHELSAQGSRASYYIPSMAMLHLMVMALVVMRTSIIQQEVYIHTCIHTYLHTHSIRVCVALRASILLLVLHAPSGDGEGAGDGDGVCLT